MPTFDKRPVVVLLTAMITLLMLHYLKYNTTFNAATMILFEQTSEHPRQLWHAFSRDPFYRLYSQLWWSSWHVVTFIALPTLAARLLLGDRPGTFGIGWGETHRHWLGYLLLVLPILFFIVLVSKRQDFLHQYPFYKLASRSWFDLLAWEFLYLIQFVCVEYFFRGFLLQSLRPTFGNNALFVMLVPYLMIHFPKPWLEATGAIAFGFFLGILALRSRSIWGGVMVHITIAASMDVAALLRTSGLPKAWWPF